MTVVITMKTLGVAVPWKSAKTVKDFLDSQRLLWKSLKTIKSADRTRVVFPLSASVTRDQIEDALKEMPSVENEISSQNQDIQLKEFDFPVCKNRIDERYGERGLETRVAAVLNEIIQNESTQKEAEEEKSEVELFSVKPNWEERMPKWKWERHEDLIVLLQDPCFQVGIWESVQFII